MSIERRPQELSTRIRIILTPRGPRAVNDPGTGRSPDCGSIALVGWSDPSDRLDQSAGVLLGGGDLPVAESLLLNKSRPQRQLVAPDGLTEREREVLALIAQGSSNARIARALGRSLKTVQNYVSRILDELQVGDRTQAALRARDVIA